MKNNKSISKVSLMTGTVAFELMAVISIVAVLLIFEINLANSVIDEHVIKMNNLIDVQEKLQRDILGRQVKINADIINHISSVFMYNFEPEGLRTAIQPFLSLSEITAIEAEQSNAPFAAVWKDGGIKSGENLPAGLGVDKKFSLQADSFHEGEKVGIVRVYYTDKHLKEQIERNKEQIRASAIAFRKDTTSRINNAITIQGISVLCVLLAISLMFVLYLQKVLIRPVRQITNGLKQGANDAATVSERLLSASDKLAKDSSTQASSLGQTSMTLEAIASMSKENAEFADQASREMNKATRSVDKAKQSMDRLISAMEEITKAGDKIQSVVKGIDEIAFQTNLLALNAAVEAARAGDAGNGFAIVAEEVRNLAMRSARAAKKTRDLIENTITEKLGQGSEQLILTGQRFAQVIESAEKIAGFIEKIVESSHRQSSNTGEIQIAVSEADRIAQNNVSQTEELVHVSVQMNTQAGQVENFAVTLTRVIGGI